MPAIASFSATHALSERRLRDPQLAPEAAKKRVLVTGGSGKLGRWVVRDLVEHGYEVFNLDVMPPAPSEADVNARFVLVDLRDYGQVVSTIMDVDSGYKGVDAIVHLAAIPAPARAPNHVIFHTNSLQTYNILEAARVTGIRHVALASSETVFGIPLHPHAPATFPLTEDVERPESSYSLSKLVGEKLSEQYCRWDPATKIINIRLSNVIAPEEYAKFESWQHDPWERAWNGFCYIDTRDCAQAFRLAIESELTGFHVFNIANADIAYREQTTAELAKLVFPDTPYTPETDDPREGLISIKKAREVLGYNPTHDWQTEVAKLKTA